jgi:hypothetical protein
MARRITAIGLMLALVGACAAPSFPPAGVDPSTGFPYGAFAKEIDDPDFGRVGIHWSFTSDGRWAEIPHALDGQTLPIVPVRGRYAVDGDEVTMTTDFPPGMGTSVHTWRVDGEDLWTTFVSSDLPDDAAWFAGLDRQPWKPAR